MVGLTAERPSVKLKDILAQDAVKAKDVGSMGVSSVSSLTCDSGGSGCACYSCECVSCQCYGSSSRFDIRATGINDLVGGVRLKKGDDQLGNFRVSSPVEDYHESYVPDTPKDYSNQ